MSLDHSPMCPVDGCTKKATVAGACRNHYASKYQRTSDGRRSGRAQKLTDDQCAAIRKRSSQFATQRQIAREFHVDIETVRAVLKRTGAYAEADR